VVGEPVFPRDEYASGRQWRMSRLGRLVRWPWFPVPVWILVPLVLVGYTGSVAAALAAAAWFAFGVRFWVAWLLVEGGLLLYFAYGFVRMWHRWRGPGGSGGVSHFGPGGPRPGPPRGRWWKRPDGGVRHPRSPKEPRPSLSSAVDPDDPTTGHASGATG
jgi:hypothetical protein